MNSKLNEVLSAHEVKGEQSCISWGLEFILKLHGKINLDAYPIQTAYPRGTGFGSIAHDILRESGIHAWDEHLDWTEFENHSKKDICLGFPLIFSLPTSVNINVQTASFGEFGFHVCVASQIEDLPYVTRQYNNRKLVPICLPGTYNFLRERIAKDYKVHVLRHNLMESTLQS